MIQLNANSQTILIGATVIGLGYLFAKHEASKAAASIGQAVNPVSHDNIFNQGANAVVNSLSGGKHRDFADVLIANRGKPNVFGFIEDILRPD